MSKILGLRIKVNLWFAIFFTLLLFQLALDKGKNLPYMKHLAENSYIARLPAEIEDASKKYINDSMRGVIPYKGSRPIYVFMAPKWYMYDYIAMFNGVGAYGVAYSIWPACIVMINEDLKRNMQALKETLMHEILHCYGYEHTPFRNDVMYTYGNDSDKSKSYRAYYLDIIRRKHFR